MFEFSCPPGVGGALLSPPVPSIPKQGTFPACRDTHAAEGQEFPLVTTRPNQKLGNPTQKSLEKKRAQCWCGGNAQRKRSAPGLGGRTEFWGESPPAPFLSSRGILPDSSYFWTTDAYVVGDKEGTALLTSAGGAEPPASTWSGGTPPGEPSKIILAARFVVIYIFIYFFPL